MNRHTVTGPAGQARCIVDRNGRWTDELMSSIDRKDAVAFGRFLHPDATFRFGNAAPVHGRDAIVHAVAGFFSALRSLHHRVEDRWMVGNTAILAGSVTYTRHDGSTLEVPFANVLGFEPDGVRDYRIFVDVSALFAD